jgi:hypothetical protein
MGAGAAAGHAHMGDGLSRAQPLTHLELYRPALIRRANHTASEVAVGVLIVPGANHQPIAAPPALEYLHQHTAPPVANRGTERGRDVQSVMGTHPAIHRMDAQTETTRIAGEDLNREGGPQPGFPARGPGRARGSDQAHHQCHGQGAAPDCQLRAVPEHGGAHGR